MTNWQLRFALIPLLAVMIFPVVAEAEKSVAATISWDGEGRVFRIDVDTIMFLGALEGIIYLETPEGKLDKGYVMCPATVQIAPKTQATTGSGHCMITASGGDTVFAKWSCSGQADHCKGNFKLTGGSGQFDGITGSSTLEVRSPLSELASDMASGSAVRVPSGIAILPELQYTMPARQ